MVRLKENATDVKDIYEQNFNSNMVRLKAEAIAYISNHVDDFNSNMVRLKGLLHDDHYNIPVISIPMWCD